MIREATGRSGKKGSIVASRSSFRSCASCNTTTATKVLVTLPMIHGVLPSIGAPVVGSAAPAVTVNDAPEGSRSASTAPGNSRPARWRSRIRVTRSSDRLGAPGWPTVARVAQPAVTAEARISGKSSREAMRAIEPFLQDECDEASLDAGELIEAPS